MISKKTKLIALGCLCASILTAIVGLIVFLIAINTQIDPQAVNYAKLMADKAFTQLMGIVVMCSAIPVFLISVGIFCYSLIKKINVN